MLGLHLRFSLREEALGGSPRILRETPRVLRESRRISRRVSLREDNYPHFFPAGVLRVLRTSAGTPAGLLHIFVVFFEKPAGKKKFMLLKA